MSETPGRRPLPPELDPRRGLKSPTARKHAAARTTIGNVGLRRFARAVSWVATLTSSVVLLVSAGLYAYVNVLNNEITRIGVFCVKNCDYTRPTEVGNAENYLLVGSDSRAGDNSTGVNAGLADASTGGQRSDTTMLVHISANRDKVTVISFPRDLYVQIPAYKTSTGQQVGTQSAKFNAAFAYGGAPLLVQMMETNFGLRVDHYIDIDFAGFQSMVDALGGVEICLSVAAYDPGSSDSGGSGFKSSAGRHVLNGIRALEYVRQRDGLPQGDLDRVQRQQRFLSSVIRKVKSAGTLTNPARLNSFLQAAFKSVTVDKQTSLDDLTTLAKKMQGLDPAHIQFFTVPTNGGHNAGPSVGSVLDIDAAPAHVLFQDVHDDIDPAATPAKASPSPSKAPTSAAASSPAPTVTIPLSSVSVSSVQNASGTTGLGTTAANDLRALGVNVASVTTAATSGATTTTIHYGTGKADSAKTLAAAIPGSTLVPDSSLPASGLEVLVGSSYTAGSAHSVTVTGSPSTTPVTPTSPATSSPAATVKPNLNAATGDCGP